MRNLYNEILEYSGKEIFKDLLKPWGEKFQTQKFTRSLVNPSDLTPEVNWELYALSRILDLLALRLMHGPTNYESSFMNPDMSISDYVDFVELLGFRAEYPVDYHPFNCEVIETRSGDIDYEIVSCIFPAIKFNNLLIKRSGVVIRNDSNNFDLNLINSAAIYWAFRRSNRACFDLSHGWGGNSQWRTEFRIDLETEKNYLYNINGKFDLNLKTNETLNELASQNLEVSEAIELLVNRQFISCRKDDSDLFPYDFRYEERK